MKQALLEKKRGKTETTTETVEGGDMEACEEEPREEDPPVETEQLDASQVCWL